MSTARYYLTTRNLLALGIGQSQQGLLVAWWSFTAQAAAAQAAAAITQRLTAAAAAAGDLMSGGYSKQPTCREPRQ